MLMLILIRTVTVVMYHAVAKLNMIIVNVRDTEVKVEEMDLLEGAAAAE